jgi:tRNA A37 threonylcarbamoyltransferase TsaD
VFIPPIALSTDNAAMIGAAALAGRAWQPQDYLALDAYARSPLAG